VKNKWGDITIDTIIVLGGGIRTGIDDTHQSEIKKLHIKSVDFSMKVVVTSIQIIARATQRGNTFVHSVNRTIG
jgi:hypothetical protein